MRVDLSYIARKGAILWAVDQLHTLQMLLWAGQEDQAPRFEIKLPDTPPLELEGGRPLRPHLVPLPCARALRM